MAASIRQVMKQPTRPTETITHPLDHAKANYQPSSGRALWTAHKFFVEHYPGRRRRAVQGESAARIPNIGPVEACAKCEGPVDMSDWPLTFTECHMKETGGGLVTREFAYLAVVCKVLASRTDRGSDH